MFTVRHSSIRSKHTFFLLFQVELNVKIMKFVMNACSMRDTWEFHEKQDV
jgi:hypothetical protein